jgi:transketolase
MSEQKQNYKVDLRKAFVDTLMELAEKDDKIVFIIPDVGFSFIERFKEKYPNRFFNFGVTEQSCMIIAAGMALAGMKPYVYSMINFVAFRPFEMVRNAIAMHNANVKILGVSGSVKYKFLGFSHNLLFDDEDVYHLKPYMDCCLPTNDEEVKTDVLKTYENQKACYIRL